VVAEEKAKNATTGVTIALLPLLVVGAVLLANPNNRR
jgi:hypothetical protein